MKRNHYSTCFRLLFAISFCFVQTCLWAITEIHVETAGTLSSLLTSTDKQLKLTGSINKGISVLSLLFLLGLFFFRKAAASANREQA